jgi:hypothetical protein
MGLIFLHEWLPSLTPNDYVILTVRVIGFCSFFDITRMVRRLGFLNISECTKTFYLLVKTSLKHGCYLLKVLQCVKPLKYGAEYQNFGK